MPDANLERREQTELPMQVRALPIASVNAEARTVDVVFSTGAAVRRVRWGDSGREVYDEVLLISPNSINMERLAAGAAVVDSHSVWTTRSQVAVVDRAWVEGGKALARLRFPSSGIDDAADRMWGLVSEGIIRNISVGYSQDEVRIERPERIGEVGKWTVTRWTPFEISFVTVGADSGAQVREAPQDDAAQRPHDARHDGTARSFPAVILSTRHQEHTMPDNVRNTPETPANAPETQNPEMRSAPADSGEVLAAERQRVSEITALARQHGMNDAFVDNHVRSGTSVADVGRKILDELASRARATDTPTVRITTDEGDTRRAAIETAILHRANPQATELTAAAREWRGMSLIEIGRLYVEETRGVRLRGLGKNELAGVLLGMDTRSGMLSTSDFGNLLANVASKRLRDGYKTAVQTWRPFSRQSNAPDFKERAIVQLSGMPEFKKVREGQEYTHASLSDSVEKYALATYGRIVAITRQTIINDDLGAFDRIPSLFGRAAAELESDTVWGILLNNPNMGDGKALFHADHGNLVAAGAPSEATLEAADIAMGAQVDAAGKPLNIKPKFLAVSRKHKVAAQKLLTSVQATKTGDINVYQNAMDLIVEDRLYKVSEACPWFTIGDPAQWDTIEFAYLEGQEGLYTEQRIGFEVDGVEVKGRLDFAAKAIDFKGFQKNPGN